MGWTVICLPIAALLPRPDYCLSSGDYREAPADRRGFFLGRNSRLPDNLWNIRVYDTRFGQEFHRWNGA